MDQAQQKRAQFRKEIRRKHINDRFLAIRNLHNEREKSNSSSCEITQDQKAELRQKIQHFIYKSIINYQSRDYAALFQDIQAMAKLATVLPGPVSISLNQELMAHGALLIDGVKKDLSKLVLDQLGTHLNIVQPKGIEEQISSQTSLRIVCQLMDISGKLHYQKYSEESLILIIKAIWNVFSSECHLPKQIGKNQGDNNHQENSAEEAKQREKLLMDLCASLHNMLESPSHVTIKKHLQKMGLSKKLNQIIDASANLNLRVHVNLLQLLYLYNSNEIALNGDDICINGISITGTDSTYKQKFALYCIYFIRKGWPELHELALLTLNQIFEESPHFIDSIKTDYYGKILEFTLSTSRRVNVAALSLLGTLAFYSPSATDELVEKNNIIDFLYGRLAMERQMPAHEPYTKKSVEKCTNIVCDLLLTRDKKVKKLVVQHHIWEMLFQSIQEHSPLFGAVIAFKFYFNAISRKQAMKFLPSFLQAVSCLSLNNELIPEIKEIKQTLLNIFYTSMMHYPEENHNQVIRLFQTNNLLKHIQDYEISSQQQVL